MQRAATCRRLDTDHVGPDAQRAERHLDRLERRPGDRDRGHAERRGSDGERHRVAIPEVAAEGADPDRRLVGRDERRRDRGLDEEREPHREDQLAGPGAQRSVDALGADVPRRQVVRQRHVDRRGPAGVRPDEPTQKPVAEVAAWAIVAAATGRVAAFAVPVVAGRLVGADGGEQAAADARVQGPERVDDCRRARREQLFVDGLDEHARRDRAARRIERADRQSGRVAGRVARAVRAELDGQAPVRDAVRDAVCRRLFVAVAREPDAQDLDARDVGGGKGGAEGGRRLDGDGPQAALEEGEQVTLGARLRGAAGEPQADRVADAVGALIVGGTGDDQSWRVVLLTEGGAVRRRLRHELDTELLVGGDDAVAAARSGREVVPERPVGSRGDHGRRDRVGPIVELVHGPDALEREVVLPPNLAPDGPVLLDVELDRDAPTGCAARVDGPELIVAGRVEGAEVDGADLARDPEAPVADRTSDVDEGPPAEHRDRRVRADVGLFGQGRRGRDGRDGPLLPVGHVETDAAGGVALRVGRDRGPAALRGFEVDLRAGDGRALEERAVQGDRDAPAARDRAAVRGDREPVGWLRDGADLEPQLADRGTTGLHPQPVVAGGQGLERDGDREGADGVRGDGARADRQRRVVPRVGQERDAQGCGDGARVAVPDHPPGVHRVRGAVPVTVACDDAPEIVVAARHALATQPVVGADRLERGATGVPDLEEDAPRCRAGVQGLGGGRRGPDDEPVHGRGTEPAPDEVDGRAHDRARRLQIVDPHRRPGRGDERIDREVRDLEDRLAGDARPRERHEIPARGERPGKEEPSAADAVVPEGQPGVDQLREASGRDGCRGVGTGPRRRCVHRPPSVLGRLQAVQAMDRDRDASGRLDVVLALPPGRDRRALARRGLDERPPKAHGHAACCAGGRLEPDGDVRLEPLVGAGDGQAARDSDRVERAAAQGLRGHEGDGPTGDLQTAARGGLDPEVVAQVVRADTGLVEDELDAGVQRDGGRRVAGDRLHDVERAGGLCRPRRLDRPVGAEEGDPVQGPGTERRRGPEDGDRAVGRGDRQLDGRLDPKAGGQGVGRRAVEAREPELGRRRDATGAGAGRLEGGDRGRVGEDDSGPRGVGRGRGGGARAGVRRRRGAGGRRRRRL